MSDSTTLAGNPLLTNVMVRIRHERPELERREVFYVRTEDAMGGMFAQLWFLTRGCTWDRRGACTMCNYGQGPEVTASEMVDYVRMGLESIKEPLTELYVSPSGSLLDEREVPLSARHGILDLVEAFPVDRFSFESRVETIRPTSISDVLSRLPGTHVAIGFGLESADPWVGRFCVNKPDQPGEFLRATALLADTGIEVYSNIAIGHAFLTPYEAVLDARRSVEWSLANGASMALLFPLHVKRHTLLAWLHERGLYDPPSLWSLIAVLESLPPDLLPRVTISWYRADYGKDPGVIASPSTCPECLNEVFATLDLFRANPSNEAVDQMRDLDCRCRSDWQARVIAPPRLPIHERVLGAYREIADGFDLGKWWDTHASSLRDALVSSSPWT